MSHQDRGYQDFFDDIETEEDPGEGYGGRRNELVSYPNSVMDRSRQEITRIQQQSQQAMREAMQELARTQGDVFALLMASPFGKTDIEFGHEDSTVETVETLKVRMGVVVGKDVTTKTTTKIQKRHHRLY